MLRTIPVNAEELLLPALPISGCKRVVLPLPGKVFHRDRLSGRVLAPRRGDAPVHAAAEVAAPVLVVACRTEWCMLSLGPLLLRTASVSKTEVAIPSCPEPTVDAGANQCLPIANA